MTTRELWRSWRKVRKDRAFAELVNPEVSHALALAKRMGANHADAEDAVQDALVALSNERSDDPLTVGVRAWICRRVVLRVKMNVRSSSRRRRRERAVRVRTESPDTALAPEVRDEVEHALALLNDDQRHVVLLRFLHDLDYREMAYVMGVTENACRLRVHKALHLLRGALGGKAPALIAALGVPAVTAAAAKAAVLPALGIKTATLPFGAKTAGVVGAVAVAATTTLVVLPKDAPDVTPVTKVVAPPPRIDPAEPTPPPRRGGGLQLLRDHFSGKRDARPLLKRPAELARMVERGRERIVIGPGVHRIESWASRAMTQGSLTIEGAGVEKTTLVATKRAIVQVIGHARGVVFSNLTFEGAVPGRERFDGNLLDVRGEAVALFENVRFRHWGTRAGYSAPVGVMGSALLVFRDCEFVGGYRRRHGGYALSIRGDTLAVFERCRFFDLDAIVAPYWKRDPPSSRTALRVHGCALINTALEHARTQAPPYTVRMEASEKRTTPRPTLRDLRAVVDGLPRHNVRAVLSIAWEGAPEFYFQVALLGGKTILVVKRRGAIVPVSEAGFSLRTLHAQDEGPALGEIAEWPDRKSSVRCVRAVKGTVQTDS